MSADRREQGKAERRARIVAAATRLFAQEGYDQVTTRQVAQAADVGMGTLFRHAGSKAALLVLVMNDRLDEGARQASALVASGAPMGRAVAALVEPLVAEGALHPQNLRAYQRETLFGPPELRQLAVEHLTLVEATVLALLRERVTARSGVDLTEVARLVNSAVTMELIRAGAGSGPFDQVGARVERAVDLLMVGLVAPRS